MRSTVDGDDGRTRHAESISAWGDVKVRAFPKKTDMSFKFEFLSSYQLVMLHGASPPPAAGWRDYLVQIRDMDLSSLGLLVFTSGGAPDPAQRQELNQVLDGRYFARAIVHESAIVRGVVAAVGWFAPGVKAFSPPAWANAASHAKFTSDQLSNVTTQVRRLHAGMSQRIPWLEGAMDYRPTSLRPDDRSLCGLGRRPNRPSLP
jgi:hypothetical protein